MNDKHILLIIGGNKELIPYQFVNEYRDILCDNEGNSLTGDSRNDVELCSNMENILYKESWENIIKHVHIKWNDGIYRLIQNENGEVIGIKNQ